MHLPGGITFRQPPKSVIPIDGNVIHRVRGFPQQAVGIVDITVYRYDALGRLTECYTPGEMRSGVVYNTLARYEYDAASRLTRELHFIDSVRLNHPEGEYVSISYTYNSDGTIRERNDSAGGITTFTYDRVGNITQEEVRVDELRVRVTQYSYDSLNRVAQQRVFVDRSDIFGQEAVGQMSLSTSFTYDRNGNLLTSTDARGIQTKFTYDALDRLLSTSVPGTNENGASFAITTENTYDNMGNIITQRDERGGLTRNT